MGLYDNYRLQNSTRVPEYQGSVVPELMQVAQVQQQKYDTAQNGMDWASQFLGNMKATPNDTAQLQEVMGGYRKKIGDLSKRPDLENSLREVTMMGRDLPNDYAGFAARMKDRSDYKEELDKRVTAGKLTPERQMALMQMSDYYDKQAGGIQRDPSTGKYNGRYVGKSGVDDYNWNENVDKWMKGAKPVVDGEKVEFEDGKWIRSRDRKTVTMDPRVIDEIIKNGIANDPHAQSDLRLQQEMASYNLDYSKVDPKSLDLPADIQARLDKGESLTSIKKSMAADNTVQRVITNALNYGKLKYTQHDREVGTGIKENGYERDKAAKLLTESNRFLMPGADIQLEPKEKDPKALAASVTAIDTDIKTMQQQLSNSNLAPDERKKIENNIIGLQDQKEAKESIMKLAADAVAQKMGYKNKADFDKQTSSESVGAVQQSIGVVGRGLDGGPKAPIQLRSTDKIKKDNDNKRMREEFDKNYTAEIKNNAQNYSFKPMAVSLTKDESEGLKTAMLGSKSSFQWFKPGELTSALKDSKVADIKDFDLSSMTVMHKGGSYYMNAYEKSTEKGKIGQPTGANYMVRITPGSNVGRVIADNILSKAKTGTIAPEMLRTAAILSGRMKFSGDIASLQNGEEATIRGANNKVFATIKREKYQNSNDARYVLYGSDGKPIPGYTTTDMGTADGWLSTAVEQHLKD